MILFSIIALEKFAQTSENKLTIHKRLADQLLEDQDSKDNRHLLGLEEMVDHQDYLETISRTERRRLSPFNVAMKHFNAIKSTREERLREITQ